MRSIAMTEGDYALIMQAEKAHYTDWDIVDDMIDKAVSDEAKEKLRGIRNYLHHKEEFANGNL